MEWTNTITVLLSFQALWNWNICQSRVSVQLYLREANYDESCNNCRFSVTFCLQQRDQEDSLCPFGMESFRTSEGMFGDSDVIGRRGTTNVNNPLLFFVNQTSFSIQLTVSGNRIDEINDIRGVVVESELGSMITVSSSDDSRFMIQYNYIVQCDVMYYGSNCSRYCEDTDDETGHFICDGSGNPICLPGYNHSSVNDNRCTQCIENCTSITTEGAGASNSNNADRNIQTTTFGQTSGGLSSGATAAIVICVLLFLTAAVVGGLTALLLTMYRPWAADSKVNEARTRSTSKALNNPIYEEETFDRNIHSDGGADLRDRTLKDLSRTLEESSPLYASEMILEESQREVERSVFMDNKSLVNVLDNQDPTGHQPPSSQPQVAVDIDKGVATYDGGIKKQDTRAVTVDPSV